MLKSLQQSFSDKCKRLCAVGSKSPSRTMGGKRRKGIAVVLVLGILAMTLALSYVMIRSQSETLSLQDNQSRAELARLAAFTGTSTALRQMHESTWTGVGTPISGRLDATTTYNVSYTVGDSALATNDPLYSEFPFRVTIESQGTSTVPNNAAIKSTYTVKTVVQLARRALNSGTSHTAWDDLQALTLYQWGSSSVSLNFPFKMSGNSTFLGTLQFCTDYPSGSSNIDRRYLQDLNAMRSAGQGDYRPLQGNLKWNGLLQSFEASDYVSNRLGVSTTSMLLSAFLTPPIVNPGDVTTYQLYPGGPTYNVANASAVYGSSISNASVQPSMTDNPLGLVRASSNCNIGSNCNFTGAFLFGNSSANDIVVSGTNVQLSGINLPAIEGNATTYQLPLMIAADEVRFTDGCGANVNGLIMAWQTTNFEYGTKNTNVAITGRAFTRGFNVRGRTEWDDTVVNWSGDYTSFLAQYNVNNPPSSKFFPLWLAAQRNLQAPPTLNLDPPTNGVRYHWPDWTQPIYGIGSGDAGLVWNTIRQEQG